jgi:hypothetical protein
MFVEEGDDELFLVDFDKKLDDEFRAKLEEKEG